ncbi:TonB-dependent receptor [Sphingobacterium hungaricum]
MTKYFLVAYFFLISAASYSQEKIILSGFVKDAGSGESLIGALIQQEGTNNATSSNSYGFFSLTLTNPNAKVSFSFIGYETQVQDLQLTKNSRITVELKAKSNEIDEVVITGNQKNGNVTSPQMGRVNFTMEEIANVPVVFGEKDILKTIQLLPGVASGGEGTSNFYVRGGGSDQNLILLDEATVYNAAHLLGFFSTFNSDAIKDVTLYKGGIPAQYGGRISSVLDISMLDGNNKEFGVEGGLGLIASRLKVEGPIVKDKSSFMLSGRRTYADLFLKLSNDEKVNSSKLYFYDLNAKANYKFNDRNTLYVSGYFGKDDLSYSDLFSFDWGNATATARWNHIVNDKLFSNTSLIYSDFSYNVNVNSDDTDFTIASKIRNFNFKEDFAYYATPVSTFRFGLNVLHQKISPASIDSGDDSNVNSISVDSRQGLEAAAYISHDWKPLPRLGVIYGLRLTNFSVLGPGTFYQFDQDGEVRDQNNYGSEIVKNYLYLEPRLSLSYQISDQSSVKTSFNRIVQNLHQLTNTTSSLPTDQYVVSSENIKPQIADQVAIGYFRNFANNTYEFSMEAYYKSMHNQIDFRNGADLQANAYLEGELLYGIGRSYGLEWYFKKQRGRLTGWLSYTLAKSERQFDQINEGEWFNARQDRTHDISLVGIYDLSKKWTLGATFVYNTGNAVTFPSGKYVVDGRTTYYYTERNGYRMPDYHRLDLSATYDRKLKNKKFSSSWTFGVYNAYFRKNAYIIDFRESEDNPNVTEAYKVALFGIIPSVTWNFRF